MHLRGAAQRDGQRLAYVADTTPQRTNTVRSAITKKLLLWVVLLLQICIIGCFWLLLQLGLSASENDGIVTRAPAAEHKKISAISNTNQLGIYSDRVNFITKTALELRTPKTPNLKKTSPNINKPFRRNNFEKDFYRIPNRLNSTGIALEAAIVDAAALWCFREGTQPEAYTVNSRIDEESGMLWSYEKCKCTPQWHGKDCGQPEVMWRTLMTAKGRIKLLNPSEEKKSHQLVYMMEGNFFDLDLLELQVKAVNEVVDYFIIFNKNSNIKLKELKLLERKMKEILSKDKYYIHHCGHLTSNRNCTTAFAYRTFKQLLQSQPVIQVQRTDLFLYSEDREIISSQALKFLKYYAADVQLMRFRLKYNVYGFYWQHPQQTHLAGLISTFEYLDSPDIGSEDPIKLLSKANRAENSALVIGDLNHFGGWYCKYCQQPGDIIYELYAERDSLRHVPNITKHRRIDIDYLQSLMANGIYVDGKLQLIKLRSYADNYYAPLYAVHNQWKFGHLILNLLETLNDDETIY